MMKWSHMLGAVVIALLMLAPPLAAADEDPATFVNGLAAEALGIIRNPQFSQKDREAAFAPLFKGALDLPSIGQTALGRYWANAAPAQRAEFIQVFGDYLVTLYSGQFSAYSGAEFRVIKENRTAPDRTTVYSEIDREGGQPPIAVAWKVVSEGGQDKIVDVAADQLSMAAMKRDELASVLQQNGGNVRALIDLLKEKAQAE